MDPNYLNWVPFGRTSFWVQPWRSYLDTWPASKLLEAVGINFNLPPEKAEAGAQVLQESGFKLARLEIGWGSLNYEDPTHFKPSDEATLTALLTALHKHGLRPLITLNANSLNPTPSMPAKLEVVQVAPKGARTVALTRASAAQVMPGKTGFTGLTGGAAAILITSVSSTGVATLSRPLTYELTAGLHMGTTLRYAPFQDPTLANGQPNPVFQETLGGWLSYVAAVCHLASGIVGTGGYDLELWNELTFGSEFLNSDHYYKATETPAAPLNATGAATEPTGASEPASAPTEPVSSTEPTSLSEPSSASEPTLAGEEAATTAEQSTLAQSGLQATVGEPVSELGKRDLTKLVIDRLEHETVAFVRNPANGISSQVGITDGFASETPFPSGAEAPLGMTALSKHPYVSGYSFPGEYDPNGLRPVNALGKEDFLPKALPPFTPLFVPTFQSVFPEYTLSGIGTETLIRDLSPETNYVYGYPHGRNVGPPGGSPLQKWVTEYNLSPAGRHLSVVGPNEVTPVIGAKLTRADKFHFHAKALLRSLVAMVGKGMSREYFYAACCAAFGLIGSSFWSALEEHPETYPGREAGGEILSGFHNMLARFQGPGPSGEARQLTLTSISQQGNHAQFAGDCTSAHPYLYDREVLAVLPFQSSPTRFVIPVYVMTRDMLTLYRPNAPESEITRFDLPDENFRITLGNLPEGSHIPSVSAYDPLTNKSTPARLITRSGNQAEVEFAATDYPRLLTIEF